MDKITTLTLSGWAQPAEALVDLAPNAQSLDYIEHCPQSIHTNYGHYDLIIGWSLGGVLARQLLARGSVTARALVLVASPYQFVRDAHFFDAMPRDMFEKFYHNFEHDTPRTAKRFSGLVAKGDSKSNQLMGKFAHHPRLLETQHWLRWLQYLHDYRAADHDYSRLPPSLIVHGEQDHIVPLAQAYALQTKLGAQLLTLPYAGHAPHLHDAAAVRRAIAELMV